MHNLHFHILLCPTGHAGYKERGRNNFPNYASQPLSILSKAGPGNESKQNLTTIFNLDNVKIQGLFP